MELIFNTLEIDFYHRGNWFLPPRKLISTTLEIDFVTVEFFFTTIENT